MNLNYRGIIKFKIGLGVIGLFTVVLLVLVLAQAGATKQDAQTDKLANSMADSLNTYTDSNFAVPASLSEAGIKKTSPYITYTKLSGGKYKFCVTYKTTSSDFDPSTAVSDAMMGGASSWDDGSSDQGPNTDLYLPTSHHKGVNCQTVDLGDYGLTDGSDGGLGCDGGTIKTGTTADIACPLESDGSGGTGTGDDTTSAADSQRETDIDALQAHLEAYYATNGYYPTLAELNSSSWRSTNMQGLDSSALCDPSTKSQQGCQLTAAPQQAVYSYAATDTNKQNCTKDQNCTAYTLTATLSTGKQFTKQSMV